MLGFLFGAACLAGLFWVVRGGGGWRRHGGAWGRRGRALYWLFGRLDTSPGQEKAVKAALDGLLDEAGAARRELAGARATLADALAAPTFDEAALREALAAHDATVARLREAVVGATGQVHEALDERQRRDLADLLRSLPLGRHHHHHACHHAAAPWGHHHGRHAYR